MISTVRADELRPGDIMSTNGARIESVVLLQGGGIEDEVCVCYSFEAGEGLPSEQKFEYVERSRQVHLWVNDTVRRDRFGSKIAASALEAR